MRNLIYRKIDFYTMLELQSRQEEYYKLIITRKLRYLSQSPMLRAPQLEDFDTHRKVPPSKLRLAVVATVVSGISPKPDLKIPSFGPEILHAVSLRVVDKGPVIEIVRKHVAPVAVYILMYHPFCRILS